MKKYFKFQLLIISMIFSSSIMLSQTTVLRGKVKVKNLTEDTNATNVVTIGNNGRLYSTPVSSISSEGQSVEVGQGVQLDSDGAIEIGGEFDNIQLNNDTSNLSIDNDGIGWNTFLDYDVIVGSNYNLESDGEVNITGNSISLGKSIDYSFNDSGVLDLSLIHI